MTFKKFVIFLFINLPGLTTSSPNYKLELVQVIFRHGERSPQRNEMNVIGNSTVGLDRPWGLAQLTNRGKLQEYRIGTMLRKRYDDFLGEYQPDKVYAYTSAYDRTKTSLLLVLASLFRPTGQLVWKEDFPWLPIPIHFAPAELDDLFYPTQCPTYQELYHKLMDSSEMKNKFAAYEDVTSILEKHYPHIKFDFHQFFYMNNVLNTQLAFNLTMPEWYTPQRHAKISSGALFYLETRSYTPDLIRLNGGTLTRRLVENMIAKGEAKNPRKIYLYSGHELTLYAVPKAHGITPAKSPAFGSAIILEKFKDDQGKFYVKMHFWTGEEDETLMPVKLPNCDEYCRMEDYLKLVKPFLPSDDETLCLYKNLKPTDLEKILSTDSTSMPM